MRRGTTILAAVLLEGTVACVGSNDRHVAPKHHVEATELVGAWHATDEALRAYAWEGMTRYSVASAHRLELRAGGSCMARTHFGDSFGPAVESEMPCTSTAGGGQLALEVKVRPSATVVQTYLLAEKNGRLTFWAHIADPVVGRYAEFAKD